MFIKVSNPVLEVIDEETKQSIGRVSFPITPEIERNMLNLVDHGMIPPSATFQFTRLFGPSGSPLPFVPFEITSSMGILSALFTEELSGIEIPLEITLKFNALVRSTYFAASVELSNIEILDIRTAT